MQILKAVALGKFGNSPDRKTSATELCAIALSLL